MKERPVIFNGEMVRAIIDGRKTQTRRIAKADNSNHLLGCPFGQVGDRLWVRETFGDCGNRLVYRADSNDGAACKVKRWVPSIHMPRDACHLVLEITAVRVERLNDISEEDARAEGAPTELCIIGEKHYMGFRTLWKSIYGVDSWNANPWVWVIEFRRVGGSDASK